MEKTYYILEHDQVINLEATNPEAFAAVWFYCLENSPTTARRSNDGAYLVVKTYTVSEDTFIGLLISNALAYEVFTYAEIKQEMLTANWADEPE